MEVRLLRNKLRGTLVSGTTVSYRMRSPDIIEMYWRATNGEWLAGVLSKADPRSTMSVERLPTDLFENGKAISLEMIVYKPRGIEPFPTLVFNHGSTGYGNDPAVIKYTTVSPSVARFFTERGWMVAFPQRRGRGKSDGAYAEGRAPDGSGYSARPEVSLPGVERAMADIDSAVTWLKSRPEVDSSRMLIGGISRGGILATAYAGTRPTVFRGAINFVGGWLDGRSDAVDQVNAPTFRRGAGFKNPTIWLYADQDPYYSVNYSRKNFDAFTAAGGIGSFNLIPVQPKQNGHFIALDPSLWGETLDKYLATLNLEHRN